MEELEENVKIDDWFCSLPLKWRERIMIKHTFRTTGNKLDSINERLVTIMFMGLNLDTKKKIREHCEDKHGYIKKEFVEGMSMSY